MIVVVMTAGPKLSDAIQHDADDTVPAGPLNCLFGERLRCLPATRNQERRVAKRRHDFGIGKSEDWRRIDDHPIEKLLGAAQLPFEFG